MGQGQTHIHDEEVEPAPGVGEVHLEAIGHPLEQHLQDEDVGKDLVSIFQDGADDAPLLYVNVLECLWTPEPWGGGWGSRSWGSSHLPYPA